MLATVSAPVALFAVVAKLDAEKAQRVAATHAHLAKRYPSSKMIVLIALFDACINKKQTNAASG